MNEADTNVHFTGLCVTVFISPGYLRDCYLLHFIRNCQMFLESGHVTLHSQRQCLRLCDFPALPAVAAVLLWVSNAVGWMGAPQNVSPYPNPQSVNVTLFEDVIEDSRRWHYPGSARWTLNVILSVLIRETDTQQKRRCEGEAEKWPQATESQQPPGKGRAKNESPVSGKTVALWSWTSGFQTVGESIFVILSHRGKLL